MSHAYWFCLFLDNLYARQNNNVSFCNNTFWCIMYLRREFFKSNAWIANPRCFFWEYVQFAIYWQFNCRFPQLKQWLLNGEIQEAFAPLTKLQMIWPLGQRSFEGEREGESDGKYKGGGNNHLLKYSLILSLETFSGRFPTHRWRVSLTIAPANHRCWHPGGLPHPLTSPSSTSRHLKHSPHSLTSSRALTDVRAPPSPRRRPLRPCRPLSSAVGAGRSYTRWFLSKSFFKTSFVSDLEVILYWHYSTAPH